MNFDYIPELKLRWGYAGFWIIAILIVGGMVDFFKKKDWL